MPLLSKFFEDLGARPEALERLGEPCFVSFRVRRRKAPAGKLIYFNRELARELGYDELLKSYRVREKLLTEAFDLDTEEALTDPATQVPAWADYQKDPSGIAMRGNTGSGRAAYIGRHFNIKGLGRTPHAKAPMSDLYGTGRCPFVSAVWELILSNVLSTNFETGGSPVLAAFVLEYEYPVPGGQPGDTWTAATLQRIDRGALDRPTHLFHLGPSGPPPDLEHVAERMGLCEGERFVERLLHGAWSAGNISLEGHTLDLEASGMVATRTPQHTLQSRFITNYFGYEWLGQLKVLEALASDETVNRKRVPLDVLESRLVEARRAQIRKRILQLIGVVPELAEETLAAFPDEIAALATQFERLSMKMFPNLAALDSRNVHDLAPHLFDFSMLFRRYTLARPGIRSQKGRAVYALQLLRNPFVSFTPRPNAWMSQPAQARIEEECVVTNRAHYDALVKEARDFVEKLEALLTAIEKRFPDKDALSAVQAYIVNEDRAYLTCSYGHKTVMQVVDAYQNGELSRRLFGRMIELFVVSGDRRLRPDKHGRVGCDLRVFREGYAKRLLHANGSYQILISLFREKVPRAWLKSEWELKLRNRLYQLSFHSKSGLEYRCVSPVLRGSGLLKVTQSARLLVGGKEVELSEYCADSAKTPFSLNFDL